MQEAPAAHEAFAGVFAIDDVVDRGEIGFAITFAALRRGVLPRACLRVLHALGRRRVRGQEVLRARIERGLAGLQRRVALHRGEEARRAIGIETGARRNADADAVGLELLRAREARHRQFGLGQRQRREIRIVAHVGDDAGHHRGLPRLVFPDRGVLGQHMRHLVAQHRGQFRGVAGERDQAARHVKLPGRQRERVHRAGIEDRDPVGLVGAIGRRDQPVDRLADQGRQLRIVIGAAIGGEDALMLALARRRLRDGAVRLGCRRSGRCGLEPSHIAAGRKREAGAQQRRRSQEAAASLLFALLHDASNQPLGSRSDRSRPDYAPIPLFAHDHIENRCPVFESRAISRPAPQFAPPEAVRFVVLPATRHSRGHESVYFRVT